MNLEFFPHFIRKNYPSLGTESNETLIEVGEEFKKYLEDVFKDKMDKLEPIWDINPLTVIMNDGHPFKVNGYHPVLIIHFEQFVEKVKKEAQNEQQ